MPFKFGKWVDESPEEQKRREERDKEYNDSFRKYGYEDDWGDDWHYTPPVKQQGALSSFWGGIGNTFKKWTSPFSGAEDKKILQLAGALTTVQKIGRIVHRDLMRFTWKAEEATASMSSVALSPLPLESKDIQWEDAERVDALVGDALARASFQLHVPRPLSFAHSAKAVARAGATSLGVRRDHLDKVSEIAEALFYAGAYMYSEAQTTGEFPGYRGYFTRERDFVHRDSVHKKHLINAQEALLRNPNSMVAATAGVLWEAVSGKKLLEGDVFAENVAEVAEKFREAAVAVPTCDDLPYVVRDTVRDMLARFTFDDGSCEDGKEPEQSEDGAVADMAGDLGLTEKGRKQPAKALAHTTAEQIHNAVEREYAMADEDAKIPHVGFPPDACPPHVPVYTIKAEVAKPAWEVVRNGVGGLIAKTRASLLFRNEDRAEVELAKRRGDIDAGGIHKLALGDPKIFARTEIISAPKVEVGILVDESGSMSGEKAAVARKCAVLLTEALKGMRGVSVSVWGHTGECQMAKDGVLIFRYIENNVGNVHSLGSIHGRAQNFDGFAVSWCAKRMLTIGAQDTTKILFVMLDGYPCASLYGGHSAMRHVAEIVKAAQRRGVTVFGIGMGTDVNEDGLAKMYGPKNWTRVKRVKDLPKVLAKLTKQALRYGTV